MTRDPTDLTNTLYGPGFCWIRTINEANRLRDGRAERLADRAIVGLCGVIAVCLLLAIATGV